MSNAMPKLFATATSVVAIATILTLHPAEARGFQARGARGAMGGFARQGQYGQAAGAAAISQNAAVLGGAFNGTGPNGTSGAGAGSAAWKRGIGAVGASQMNVSGANGSTYSGFKRGAYNAQTGQGMYSSGKSAYSSKTGQSYGYNQDTSFAKGQGASTSVETENKGDYNVDWAKGQKPVVTPVPTSP